MKRHILKEDPKPFQELWDQSREFEIRLDDRGFEVGDEVLIVETLHSSDEMKAGAPLSYTGRAVSKEITLKLSSHGLKDGWCIFRIDGLGDYYDNFNPINPEWDFESGRK